MSDLARYHAPTAIETRRFPGVVSLRYAGHTLRYRSVDPALALEVTGPRLDFLAPDGDPATVDIRCDVGAVECSASAIRFRAGTAWEARDLDDGREEICFGLDPVATPGPWCVMRHDREVSAVTFRLAPRDLSGAMPVGFPTDEFIMARRLARSGGVLLHASSLVQDGVAYLFMGHSGAGKSTTAMHAVRVGAEVLSDDRTIVTVDADGRPRAWGTPWHGSFRRATNASAPVAGLFLAVQGDDERVLAITPARALGEAFVRLIHPASETREVARTIDSLERIVAAVPVGELRQRPTPAGYLLARRFAHAASR